MSRLKYLWPPWRRKEEREMREELDALAAIAGRKELGNLTAAMENARATWGWTWLETITADIRYAVRALRAQPVFLGVAVLSLGLAIGLNSAFFSLADAMLLRPLPIPRASGLLDVTYATPDNPLEGMSYPDYRDLRDRSRTFAGLAAYRLTTVAVAPDATAPARVRLAMLVSANFFSTTGIAPSAGRAFVREESNAAGEPAAIVSADFAKEGWGGAAAIGHSLRINGIEFPIVGIAPASFTGLDRFAPPAVYLPLAMSRRLMASAADPLEDRGMHNLVVKGRLDPGVTPQAAQAELSNIGEALAHEYPKPNHNRRASVRTELERRIQQSPQLLSMVRMLMGLVGLILVIACSSLANLLLARGKARSREIAIRLSIGAGRGRLVRQLMIESLLIAMCGAAAGVAFASLGVRLLQTLSVPAEPPSPLGVQLDWRVAEFGFLAALASCLFFGLVPAWRSVRMDFVEALKSGGNGSAGERGTLGRDLLVGGQIALATVVLIAAGMFLAGFRNMLAARPDFRIDRVVSFDTAPALLHYTPEQTRAFYRQLVARVRSMPGVAGVTMTESLPLATSQTTLAVAPEGYAFSSGREKTVVFGASVDAGYFEEMTVPILRGRAFTDADRAGSRRVAIVNRQFAKLYWPGQDAIGKRIRLDGRDGLMAEVVGVAKTGHYLTVNEAPSPYVYLPYEQNPRPRMTLIARSVGDPAALTGPLREAVRSIDANMPVFNLRPVAVLYASRATGTWLQFFQMVGTMGFVGLALALTGLYGLVAYTVSRRVKEFGIRAALGASGRDIAWLVERKALTLALAGVAAGGALSAVTTPVLASAFADIGNSPGGVYTLVSAALIVVCAAAAYAPAHRAARMDPLGALRTE